ncbi:MAG: c-type cytochrome [Proteobacteria bacterium]|nr:MAG: c-type cytochrome [Pseudomonadota bacterium]
MANEHNQDSPHDSSHSAKHHHYILPDGVAFKAFASLIVLTIITFGLSFVHLGPFNFIVGMLVACVKAAIVVAVFMNLRKDDPSNTVIFGSAFVFLAIFVVLASTDLLFRGNVYTHNKSIFKPASGPSKFKKPWNTTPELVAHGKEVFSQQCVSCHGAAGLGDGPAAAALIPHPRNFTQDAGWKNGRKPSQIFKTLKEGIPGSAMASFATLSMDDRWGVTHYVASLGPNALKDETSDLAKIDVDPTKETAGDDAAPSVPVEWAMKQLVQEAGAGSGKQVVPGASESLEHYGDRLQAETFSKQKPSVQSH